MVAARDRSAVAARREHHSPRPRRRCDARGIGDPARVDRRGARASRRGVGVRARIRTRARRRAWRPLHRDVRQRPDARLRRRRPAGGPGAARTSTRGHSGGMGHGSRAVVLSGVRTPIGRDGGALSGDRPDGLAGLVIAEAVARSGVDANEIEDVYFGCANQPGEDNRNVARMGALLAGLQESVAGVTVNRLCASGLTAVAAACHAVIAGDGDLFVAGGVESMSRAPFAFAKPDKAFPRGNVTVYDTHLGWRFPNPRMEAMFPLESMGETGENVAERWHVSREDQDAFALASQQRWAAAAEAGRFDDELVPVGDVARDEHPRPDTTLEKLASLKPAFRAGGSVTAGNSSGINDGAAALVI